MIDPIENRLNELLFSFRRCVLGRAQLRRGLPKPRKTVEILKERRFYRLLIETLCTEHERAEFDLCWDIGCRNWSYAGALAETFPKARLLGVELDGGRRYWTLYRRMDAARAFAREIAEARGRRAECHFGDFAELPLDSVSGIVSGTRRWAFCFFFPFVSERPCRKWGLPSRYADFGRLIRHAGDLGREAGAGVAFLSAHQGDWELELAWNAYEEQGIEPHAERLPPESFADLWPSPYEVTLIRASLGE